MPFSWSDPQMLGVDSMDADHVNFLALLKELAEAEDSSLPDTLEKVVRHCEKHFAAEEELMRLTGFFAYLPHKAEHDRMIEELHLLKGCIAHGELGAVRAYVSYTLPRWYMLHSGTLDAVLARYIKTMLGTDPSV